MTRHANPFYTIYLGNLHSFTHSIHSSMLPMPSFLPSFTTTKSLPAFRHVFSITKLNKEECLKLTSHHVEIHTFAHIAERSVDSNQHIE